MRSSFACFAFSALALCCAGAGEAHVVFEENKSEVLEQGARCLEGFRFGVGRGTLISESGASRAAARGKSELVAKGDLIRSVALSEVDWPDSISEKSRRELSEYYQGSVIAKIAGIEKVYQEQDGNTWVTVVAVPSSATGGIGKIRFPELYKQLASSALIFSERAPNNAIIELLASQQSRSPIEIAPWEASLYKAKFQNFYLRKLPVFAGRCDVKHDLGNWEADYEKGLRAYRKGKLEEAYSLFIAAAGKVWKFDVFNMAGNIARRIGRSDEAVAMLLHAAYLAPDKPFPWVHLGFIAAARGDNELCESCCEKAESRNPDKWCTEQIAILREKMLRREDVPTSEQAPQAAPQE